MPRGQGWNAKRLREDDMEEMKGLVATGADGLPVAVAMGVGGPASPGVPPRKPAPGNCSEGFRKDNEKVGPLGTILLQPSLPGGAVEAGKEGVAGARPDQWAAVQAEKAQLMQENQQLRASAARVESESEDKRRATAELDKAKAEIER